MIKLNLDGWQLTHVDEPDPEVQQFDNEASPLVVVGEIPPSWTWEALIASGDQLNIIILTQTTAGLEAQLSASDLALSGIYTIQLRGSEGTAVKHTNKVTINVPSSLNGDAQWPEVPTAFQQALDAAVAAANDSAGSADEASVSAKEAADSADAAAASATSAAESAAIASAMIDLDFYINGSGHLIAERSENA